jgi:hypothetical protein
MPQSNGGHGAKHGICRVSNSKSVQRGGRLRANGIAMAGAERGRRGKALIEGRNPGARNEQQLHGTVVDLAGIDLELSSDDCSASPSIVSARLGYACSNPGAGDLFRAPTECK